MILPVATIQRASEFLCLSGFHLASFEFRRPQQVSEISAKSVWRGRALDLCWNASARVREPCKTFLPTHGCTRNPGCLDLVGFGSKGPEGFGKKACQSIYVISSLVWHISSLARLWQGQKAEYPRVHKPRRPRSIPEISPQIMPFPSSRPPPCKPWPPSMTSRAHAVVPLQSMLPTAFL